MDKWVETTLAAPWVNSIPAAEKAKMQHRDPLPRGAGIPVRGAPAVQDSAQHRTLEDKPLLGTQMASRKQEEQPAVQCTWRKAN